MADRFIDVGIETDATTIADDAIARLQAQWEGWEPNDGDLEVVQIEAFAQIAADAAETASIVPSAVMRTILERLHGVSPFDDGTPATTTVTFTLTDADPHVIPAGTEIDIDGVAFAVDNDQTTNALTVAAVPVTATVNGTVGNGLTGAVAAMITALAFVASVSVDAETSGGTDEETESAFLDRGSRLLELQAFTLVTTRDYELLGLAQSYVGRIVAISDTAARTIVVVANTSAGANLTAAQKTELQDLYNDYRLSNWTVAVQDATFHTINVTYTVRLLPGYDPTTVIDAADAAIERFLDPARWGQPRETLGDVASSRWYVKPTVRVYELVNVIGDVDGVDYVNSVLINGAAADFTMSGTVPLAQAGTITGSTV